MDLSVIVPVYNTPMDYLKKCFDSIRFPEDIVFEVIIIDDGSKMEVGEFCRNYANKNTFFRYFYQENKGASAARNAGIEHASGKYIMFVDADDEMIAQNVNRNYLNEHWDIIFFDFELNEGKGIQKRTVFDQALGTKLRKKDFVIAACHNRTNSACARLFRRSLLWENRIFFDESMVIAEDAKFVFSAILAADNLCYADTVIYRYNHSYDNGVKRLVRFPQKAVSNLLHYYQLKKLAIEECSDELQFSIAEKKEAELAIGTQVIEDLFNSIGTLLICGKKYEELKPDVINLATELYELCGKKLRFKTRIKCFTLKYDFKMLIRACAYLREQYTKRGL